MNMYLTLKEKQTISFSALKAVKTDWRYPLFLFFAEQIYQELETEKNRKSKVVTQHCLCG